jgi:hypothetical protein
MKGLLLLIFVYGGAVYAQDSLTMAMVHADPRVDSLVKKQIQINELTTRDSRRNIPGYRIQVANSNDRNQVFAIKTKIYQMYPELKPYLIYQPPNYKLRVGNFKTAEEAGAYMQKLTKDFPSGVYLVHDIIEVKPD